MSNFKSILTKSNRLRDMRKEINDISGLIYEPSYPTDHKRLIFLLTEIDTLLAILNLNEQRAYKECFILLRTVLEKFLFFWLMLEGTKYRWTEEYEIHPITSKSSQEARDATLEKWNQY